MTKEIQVDNKESMASIKEDVISEFYISKSRIYKDALIDLTEQK